jgi:hypothetical protein
MIVLFFTYQPQTREVRQRAAGRKHAPPCPMWAVETEQLKVHKLAASSECRICRTKRGPRQSVIGAK